MKSLVTQTVTCIPNHLVKLLNGIILNIIADDTQVYMIFKPCDKWDDISSSIKARIEDKSIWMNINMLKLNKDKTEFIIFSSMQREES